MIGWDGAEPKGLRAWEWGEAKQLLELAEILRNNFDFPGDVEVLSAAELYVKMKETVRSSGL